MYTRQSVAGKAQERAADEVRALDHERSCPQQNLCILMEFSAPRNETGAWWYSPAGLDASRCFYGSPCADISEGTYPRGFSSAHQIKRKTTLMTNANLTITAPQRGFTFLR